MPFPVVPSTSGRIKSASSCAEHPFGLASPDAQREMVCAIAAYRELGGSVNVGSFAWKGVVTVPIMSVATDTPSGASSSRRVSERLLRADFEDE